jgi:hypothetical protein
MVDPEDPGQVADSLRRELERREAIQASNERIWREFGWKED